MDDGYIHKEDASDAVIKHLQLDYEYAWGAREAINALPSADVVQVVHSQWQYKCGEVRCPECGNRIHRIDLSGYLNFCPNCGAKMDGGDEHG